MQLIITKIVTLGPSKSWRSRGNGSRDSLRVKTRHCRWGNLRIYEGLFVLIIIKHKLIKYIAFPQFQRQSTARTGIFTRSGTARPITGIGGESGGLNRPMTAVRGAGYTGSGKLQQGFDPLNSAGSKVATPSIEPKVEDT